MIHRVVFDTNTILSALVHRNGRLAWLRIHWQQGKCLPLICSETVSELTRILTYAKFRLSAEERLELLSLYLPYCEIVELKRGYPLQCRDKKDQMFLDLAHCGKAEVLISGDQDLLTLSGQTEFAIESPEAYRQRIHL